jgi:hypothetical protein
MGSQPISLGVKPPSGAQGQIFVTVRQLEVYWCGVPSLTRGQVCRLHLLLVLTSTIILGSESRGSHDHILLFQVRISSHLKGQVPAFMFPRNRVTQLCSQELRSLFVFTNHLQGYSGVIQTCLHIGSALNPLKTELLLCHIKFTSNITGNKLHLHFKAQPVNGVQGNGHC